MGVVFEAVDLETNALVALKTLTRTTPDALYRFKKEFRAHHELTHENLVSLGELFADGSDWFFTMELIRGCDFLRYVRRDATKNVDPVSATADTLQAMRAAEQTATRLPCDIDRLRDAVRQVAIGLSALHRAGMIHRDIKPSNVLVDHTGRVVIVDFGLATSRAAELASTDGFVGTAAYTAPEQVNSEIVKPAADWYALGVMIYEALTGRLPFDGTPFDILVAKRSHDPVWGDAPDGADDLWRLCRALMSRDAEQRAGLQDVMAVVGTRRATYAAAHIEPAQTLMFFGRRSELDLLEQEYRESRGGQLVTVMLEGVPGVGKTTLLRRFLDDLSAREPDTVILAGRCYERESVPYKAFDGVFDALSRVLSRAPTIESGSVVPLMGALLAHVFPVLGRVEAFADAPAPTRGGADPHEQRRRLFAAVRELFARLSSRRPVVVAIDDIQWADAESLALLRELARPPDAPACLLALTARPGTNIAEMLPDARLLTIGMLPPDDAVRVKAGIALAIQDPKQRRLLASAERSANHLAASDSPYAQGLGLLQKAQLAALRRNTDAIVELLTASLSRFEALSMQLQVAVVRRQLGKLLGGAEGAALRAESDRYMLEQEIVSPERIIATVAPAFAS
jgi:eukaryotic-like serine/threonine-protein kinase